MESSTAPGAHWDGRGVLFVLFSEHATGVELCLFDAPGIPRASRRLALRPGADSMWSLYVPDVGPGQLYGYRVDGPYAPQDGHRFNRSKLLVDPWARAITGEPRFDTSLFAFDPRSPRPELSYNSEDSAPCMPRSVVVDPDFDWGDERPPRVPWSDTVLYECHVKGMTRLHPEIEEPLRGTYLGLIEPPVLDHLKRLGVTSLELLPVHQIASEPHLVERGLTNYWGYSTLGFFAPHAGYATGGLGQQVEEFKTMVRELHRAGFEVLLDVVYNHTAEGGASGPHLSLKGVDNASFYRLLSHDRRHYVDFTGCGNTLDIRQPAVLRLVLDSLRYWVEEMHVDGFRFDLAPALGRDTDAFDSAARFFAALAADPVLAEIKRIAEPWDLGPNGYRLGGFPPPWREWNDRGRDALRRYWRGEAWTARELARRLAGSHDLLGSPSRTINYVTSHDGFTLLDLASYDQKHNEANGEANRDGHNDNLSRNWGWEGPTDEPGIRAARHRARRNLLATLALSRGPLMLGQGDELNHSQDGNNNPYCQDNETTWISWRLDDDARAFLDFARRVLHLRQRHPQLRRLDGEGLRWFSCDGLELSFDSWGDGESPAFAVHFEEALLLLLNATDGVVEFRLPEGTWHELIHTHHPEPAADIRQGKLTMESYSLVLLERSSSASSSSKTGLAAAKKAR